jgi:hypothetical protein
MSLEGKVSVGDGDGTEQVNYEPNYTVDIRHMEGASSNSKRNSVQVSRVIRYKLPRFIVVFQRRASVD